jgi:hypothetical protein
MERTRKRVRKAVWAQEGRISGRGSFHGMEMGNRTTVTAWGQDSIRGPSKGRKLASATEEAVCFLLAV